MTQYQETVNKQKLKLAAEEWANGVKCLHAHQIKSMWYDDRPQDTHNGTSVTDREFNSGLIERFKDGKIIHIFGHVAGYRDRWTKAPAFLAKVQE